MVAVRDPGAVVGGKDDQCILFYSRGPQLLGIRRRQSISSSPPYNRRPTCLELLTAELRTWA
jgi:hypothetical protein